MTKRPPTDIGDSVRARLARVARQQGEDFQFVLTRYANERWLYRLGSSRHASRFVLKGAALFSIWMGRPHRATRDIDLLGFGDPDVAHIRELFAELLALDVPEDGVDFERESLTVAPIRGGQEYGGVRAEFLARITSARIRMQVDVGFGDAVTPAARDTEFPCLLDFPAPRLRVYPRETVVAEKLEAMVRLGAANSRMKDFFDIAALAHGFAFEEDSLASAVSATFERRKTSLPTGTPVALTPEFTDDTAKKLQWAGFIRKANVGDAMSLRETGSAIDRFLEVPLAAARRGGLSSGAVWKPGGPWE
ncbi:MAG: nucleotidyl transferase AbiEii/AbiGii toxin family protein [Myxococcota bacterium]